MTESKIVFFFFCSFYNTNQFLCAGGVRSIVGPSGEVIVPDDNDITSNEPFYLLLLLLPICMVYLYNITTDHYYYYKQNGVSSITYILYILQYYTIIINTNSLLIELYHIILITQSTDWLLSM